MAALKSLAIFCILSIVLAAASPIPEPGWGKNKHTHYIIHVPYYVHTVHHHHVQKVPVYVSKHHDSHDDHHESHGWEWD